MLTVYVYRGCSTCRNALKWLEGRGIAYQEKAIRETPPTTQELQSMLKAKKGEMKRLFNSSGQDYRELGLKDQLPGMTESQAFELLSGNGNLVKRPFVIDTDQDVHLVGFKENEWEEAFAGKA